MYGELCCILRAKKCPCVLLMVICPHMGQKGSEDMSMCLLMAICPIWDKKRSIPTHQTHRTDGVTFPPPPPPPTHLRTTDIENAYFLNITSLYNVQLTMYSVFVLRTEPVKAPAARAAAGSPKLEGAPLLASTLNQINLRWSGGPKRKPCSGPKIL